MKALIVIDYTNDFVADDGKLTCGARGQSIEKRITDLTKLFMNTEDYIVFAVDAHEEEDPYHPEADLFPPHNIKGTKGRKLYGQLGHFIEELPSHEKDHYLWMDKTRYSAFAGTELELKLRERGISEVHLTGVCTDICILHTAVDAYNKGFKIVVHKDAVESFNPMGHDWALEHFSKTLGAKVVEKGVEVK
ncbi:cysteine hydrolase family protein [Salipaludibacillus aurantiacus]|uniref:Nicotinamidase-related amidase n=1 Tax=Salipaludibacillus aurantiacus TaxID=1601833 RepID=A0A1H9P3X9_9BACI|nr:isochorismatase family cysteine hydrolase [Salipaludibacillus aurantiacus]SER42910.1 Nicotinamidase-related amidase [Salipaludibacillus aurantiacus]